jgi:type II secretory pathway pseudopilin PulG
LAPVENEILRRRFAHKILSEKTHTSYAELLEQLKAGGVEYYSALNLGQLEETTRELKKLGVKYDIVQRELPPKDEKPKPETVKKEPEIIESVPPPPTTRMIRSTQSIQALRQTQRISSINFNEGNPSKTTQIKTQKISVIESTKRLFILVMLMVILGIFAFILNVSWQNDKTQNKQERQRATNIQPKQQQQQQRQSQPQQNQQKDDNKKTDKNNSNTQNQSQNQKKTQIKENLNEADIACIEGSIDTEKLYRIAISFNKNNMQAWFGLLNCFEKKGDDKKVAEIQKEMQKLFGENVFKITERVANHGTVDNFSTEGNIYRLSYFRQENSGTIEKELFSIGQNIANAGNFDKAIIFAKEGDNSGYIISVNLSDFPRTIEEFQRKIVINKIEN